MLQMKMNGLKNANRLFDLQRTVMPTPKNVDWLMNAYLLKTGSSGCLARDIF